MPRSSSHQPDRGAIQDIPLFDRTGPSRRPDLQAARAARAGPVKAGPSHRQRRRAAALTGASTRLQSPQVGGPSCRLTTNKVSSRQPRSLSSSRAERGPVGRLLRMCEGIGTWRGIGETPIVIPAKAGIHRSVTPHFSNIAFSFEPWAPAFAGATSKK
jgi:hypothetical protein